VLNLDPAKIVVILVLALVVMGPEKTLSSARHFGAMWRQLTEFREKAERQVREALPDIDLPRIPTSPRRAVTSYVSELLTSPRPNPSESAPLVVDAAGSEAKKSADTSAVVTRRVAGSSRATPREDDVSMN
jgi:Sec-independent protein translocase protein TatA